MATVFIQRCPPLLLWEDIREQEVENSVPSQGGLEKNSFSVIDSLAAIRLELIIDSKTLYLLQFLGSVLFHAGTTGRTQARVCQWGHLNGRSSPTGTCRGTRIPPRALQEILTLSWLLSLAKQLFAFSLPFPTPTPVTQDDESLKYLTHEEKDVILFFEETIDSLEDDCEEQVLCDSGVHSHSPGSLDESASSHSEPGDVIDLVQPAPEEGEPEFLPTATETAGEEQSPVPSL